MNTAAGGKNVRKTIIKRYGRDYWSRMGAVGGSRGAKDGAIKGFAADPAKARVAGQLGGAIGRRGPKKLSSEQRSTIREQFEYFQKQSDEQINRLSQRGQQRPW